MARTTKQPEQADSGDQSQSSAEASAAESTQATNAQQVTIYPLRTYQDQGELKRRGGKGYGVSKSHALQLIASGLATDKNPKG